jgi:hypothetical protein
MAYLSLLDCVFPRQLTKRRLLTQDVVPVILLFVWFGLSRVAEQERRLWSSGGGGCSAYSVVCPGPGHPAFDLAKNLNLLELETCGMALSNGQWDPSFERFVKEMPSLVHGLVEEGKPADGRVPLCDGLPSWHRGAKARASCQAP